MDPQKTHGAFSWMELQGTEASSAQSFYSDLFGWKMLGMPMQDGSTYPGFALGEQPIGGFAGKPGLSKGWLPYVTVEDTDATAESAKKAGGQIVAEPFDAPGVGRIAILEVPTGAPVAIIQYPSA